MDTISAQDGTGTMRLPGQLKHPRAVGAAFLVLALVGLALLVGVVRNAPAESGRYGQMNLTVPDPYRLPVVVLLVLLGVGVTAVLMLVNGRPANRTAVGVLAACIAAPLLVGGMGRGGEAFSGGSGCMKPMTRDQVRAAWADRPTVGEVLTGGLLAGNVADDVFLSSILDHDPDAGGCGGEVP